MLTVFLFCLGCSKIQKLDDDEIIGYWQFRYAETHTGDLIWTTQKQYSDEFITIRIKSNKLIIEKDNKKVCSCSIKKQKDYDTYHLGNGCKNYLGRTLSIKDASGDTLILNNYPYAKTDDCRNSSYCEFDGNLFMRVR